MSKRLIIKISISIISVAIVVLFFIALIPKTKYLVIYFRDSEILQDILIDYGQVMFKETVETIGLFIAILLVVFLNFFLWFGKRLFVKSPTQLDEERQERIRRKKEKQNCSIVAKKAKLKKQLEDLEKDGD